MTETNRIISVSLTQQQRDWLRNTPNSNEYIRKLLDALIAIDQQMQTDKHILAVDSQTEQMNERQRIVYNRLQSFLAKRIEATQSDIMREFTIPHATLSDYTRFFENNGLISARYEGREKYIKLKAVDENDRNE